MSAEDVGLSFDPWPADWPEWTKQYEETALQAHEQGLFGIADDLATLVSGLVQHEQDAARLEARLAWLDREITAATKAYKTAEARLVRLEEDLRRAKQSRVGVYEDKLSVRERLEVAEKRLAAAQKALAATEEGAEE